MANSNTQKRKRKLKNRKVLYSDPANGYVLIPNDYSINRTFNKHIRTLEFLLKERGICGGFVTIDDAPAPIIGGNRKSYDFTCFSRSLDMPQLDIDHEAFKALSEVHQEISNDYLEAATGKDEDFWVNSTFKDFINLLVVFINPRS